MRRLLLAIATLALSAAPASAHIYRNTFEVISGGAKVPIVGETVQVYRVGLDVTPMATVTTDRTGTFEVFLNESRAYRFIGVTTGLTLDDQWVQTNGTGSTNGVSTLVSSRDVIGGANGWWWDQWASASTADTGFTARYAATLSKMICHAQALPGSGNVYTHIVTLNGVATALTSVITNSSKVGSEDTTHSVALVAGDVVNIQIARTGTPVDTSQTCTFQLEAGNGVYRAVTIASGGPLIMGGSTRYFLSNADDPTEDNISIPVPTATSAENLTCRAVPAPTGAQTYVFTARRNGADAGPTCTITSSSGGVCQGTGTGTYVRGDRFNFKVAPTNSAPDADLSCSAVMRSS